MNESRHEHLLLQMALALGQAIQGLRTVSLDLADSPAFTDTQKNKVLEINTEIDTALTEMIARVKEFNDL